MEQKKSYNELLDELAETNRLLEEATETINAIRAGEIDALIIKSDKGTQLYTLKGSDETYRIIIEQMSEGAVTVNRQGLIVYCNSQFAAMIGIGMEKITGQFFSSFVKETDEHLFSRLFNEAWAHTVRGELMILDNGGNSIPILLSLNPLHLEEGMFLSLIMTDLTLQKETQRLLREKNEQLEAAQQETRNLNHNLEATVLERTKELEISVLQKTLVEKELRSNQEQLTRILETMVEGVQIIGTDGELMYANPMAQRLMGIIPSDDGQSYVNPMYPRYKMDDTPLLDTEDPMHRALTTGKAVYDFEIGVQPPGKEKFFLSVSAAPLKDENDIVTGSVGTFMDVTQRRKVIQQKDEFISVASHELKTPVTSLKAALQLLNELKNDEQKSQELVPKLITQANKSLTKLSVLIEDLLHVSKIRGGQLILNKQRVGIYNLVTECCEDLHQENRFNIRVAGEPSLYVDADPDKIEQVLVNFLNNAMKYASESKDIEVRVQSVEGNVKVSVADRGMGIPPEKLPHLFDRYYRVDNSGTQYSGLGLGLYICSEIIRKHKGDIGVESKPGIGSTFWFTLPVQ